MHLLRASLASTLFSLVASSTLDSLSFNHDWRGLVHEHGKLLNWAHTGSDHELDILHDHVMITPLDPGNKRGVLWSEHTCPTDAFIAQLEFRAAGAHHATGNLQLWYTKEPPKDPSRASLYTVETFDGLVIVLDDHGGSGGSVRAFLNDGNTNYKRHHHLDSLYFAHCDFVYKNHGRWSILEVRALEDTFEVMVDGRSCFFLQGLRLPAGNHFAISASSGETPDSFDVKSFKVEQVGETHVSDHHEKDNWPTHPDGHESGMHRSYDDTSFAPNSPHDAPASSIKDHEQQFADLHDRLQGIQQQLNILFNEHAAQSKLLEERIHGIPFIARHIQEVQHVAEVARDSVKELKEDPTLKDIQKLLHTVHEDLKRSHDTLNAIPYHVTGVVQGHKPRMGFFVFLIFASQVMLLVSYIIYKKRSKNAPKKYL